MTAELLAEFDLENPEDVKDVLAILEYWALHGSLDISLRETGHGHARKDLLPRSTQSHAMAFHHMALLSNWAGQDVNLQQHKGSNHERKNQWNTDGLPDAARRIVEGDRDSPSWRQKLQALEGVLCMDANLSLIHI